MDPKAYRKLCYDSRLDLFNNTLKNDIFKDIINQMMDDNRLANHILNDIVFPESYKFVNSKQNRINYHRVSAGIGKGLKSNFKAIDCLIELALRMAYFLSNINKFPIINDFKIEAGHTYWIELLAYELREKKDDIYFELMFNNEFSPLEKYKLIIWTCMISYLFNLDLEDVLVKFIDFFDFSFYKLSYVIDNKIVIEPIFKNDYVYYAFKDWNFFHKLPVNKNTGILSYNDLTNDIINNFILNIDAFNDFINYCQENNKILFQEFLKLRDKLIKQNRYNTFDDFLNVFSHCDSINYEDYVNNITNKIHY